MRETPAKTDFKFNHSPLSPAEQLHKRDRNSDWLKMLKSRRKNTALKNTATGIFINWFPNIFFSLRTTVYV